MPTSPSTPGRPHKRVPLSLDRSGGANPADAQATDINVIIAQYKRHGTLPMVPNNSPLYGDFTFPEDIHAMREAVEGAEDRFDNLPSEIRILCDYDWVKFIEKFDDPTGRQALIDAGLEIGEPTTAQTAATNDDSNDDTPPNAVAPSAEPPAPTPDE